MLPSLEKIEREIAITVRYEHLCEMIQRRSDEMVRQRIAAGDYRTIRRDDAAPVTTDNVWFFMLLACIDLKYSHFTTPLARRENRIPRDYDPTDADLAEMGTFPPSTK